VTEEIYKNYKAVNRRVARGEQIYFGQRGSALSFYTSRKAQDRVLVYPKIGIYTGSGASHSWLWFVELFDRMGFYDVTFLNEDSIRMHGLDGLDVLVISGGDTFAVAEGLGARGAETLESFVRNGGLYVGSCAGAYLPLKSSKIHLNLFNYVDAKITNVTKILPKARRVPEKFCTPYGCSYIFHPVREEVRLLTNGILPFKGAGSVFAPLYGGPSMLPSEKVEVLAHYESFTDKTIFLVDNELAQETLIGKAAAIKAKMGSGHFYLFGPHFEHPYFSLANKLVADAIYWEMRPSPLNTTASEQKGIVLTGDKAKKLIKDIKRELSNARIVAYGIEMLPVHWLIGNKIYEPGKIRMFLESMWVRLKRLEKLEALSIKGGEHENIVRGAVDMTVLLKKIKGDVEKGLDTVGLATKIFRNLNMLSTIFLGTYFVTVNAQFRN
jgi:glutamine amidotransferase-like uncharacterized protein